ncbi:helix-turn-helix transcriptional regulator [Paenibacillus pasadenensis]|uniref:winged helix-turn-helix transcriptional regulator n=1 Tax=Paenibacillus pasadenensis TaxID=217090 RepID=UPI00203EB57B|nr:helix-turn-helix domain-containing protein [Paenibacillus pasadenensis]MCM3746470.1 helix-turn-helix transcriptional regulator [Paenibacillus pasadenensis]
MDKQLCSYPALEKHGFTCPVEMTMDVIGGKWKCIVIHHLLDGSKRYNELRRLMPKVTQRMLTLQLRELERDGLVVRRVYNEVPPKVEYSLTEFGRELAPLVRSMMNWALKHADTVMENRAKLLVETEV